MRISTHSCSKSWPSSTIRVSNFHSSGIASPATSSITPLPEGGVPAHLAVVESVPALSQKPVAEAMERPDHPALLHDHLELLGERAVVADEERPAAAGHGVVEELPGDQGLAGSRGPVHPEAKGMHLDAAEEVHQLGAQAREVPLLAGHMGMHVRHEIERLAEELLDALGLWAGVPGPKTDSTFSASWSRDGASTIRLASSAAAFRFATR